MGLVLVGRARRAGAAGADLQVLSVDDPIRRRECGGEDMACGN